MFRLRLGFPLLVAILLLVLLNAAPNAIWPPRPLSSVEMASAKAPSGASARLAATSASAALADANTTHKSAAAQQSSSFATTSSPLPLPAVAQSPLATPISAPSGYVEANVIDNDQRRIRIAFHFDRPMDEQSVAWALSVSPPVATLRTWADNTLTVEPSRPLPASGPFVVLLKTTATDRNGVPLAAELRYDWWVTPLQINVAMPQRNEPGQPLAISFNYALYGESALQALRSEPAIPGALEWDLKNKQLLLYPDPPLLANTTYTLFFDQKIFDEDGEEISPSSFMQFTTPPPFTTGSAGSGPLHPALALRLTFDRAMNAATTAAALTLSPPVSVTLGWLDQTLLITPTTQPFAAHGSYAITLEPTATAANGSAVISQRYVTQIAMGDSTALGDMGYGPNLQVLLADGPRTLQYRALDVELPHDFELYALTPAQFLAHYAADFTVTGYDQPALPVLNLAEAERVAAWQEPATSHVTMVSANSGYPNQAATRQTSLPASVPPGLYLLQMRIGVTQSQLFVVLTHHNLVVKQGASELTAWLSSSDGKPTAGAYVTLYDYGGEALATATSDDDGLLQLSLATGGDKDQAAPMLLLAEVENGAGGSEITLAGLDSPWSSRDSTWRWGWPAPAPAPSTVPTHAAYLYTDRPIYQPGQIIHYKAILRLDDDAELTLPSLDTVVQVRLRDARNNIVRTLTASPNSFGALAGDFALADGAMAGDYRLEVVIGDDLFYTRLQVQSYRKPDFQVTLTADAPISPNQDQTGQEQTGQEQINFTVASQFLWGEPLANAQVRWQQFYRLPDTGDSQVPPQVITVKRGEASLTNSAGDATFTLPVADFNQGYPPGGRWGVEATVEDAAHQSVSTSTLLDFAPTLPPVQTNAPAYQLINYPFTVAMTATNPSGEVEAGRVLVVNLTREPVSTMTATLLYSATVTTDAAGRAQAPLTLPEVGYYILSIKQPGAAEANAEPKLLGGATIAAINPHELPQDPNLPYLPFLVTLDRATYQVGDEARITILSRFGGSAWLTTERGEIHTSQLVALTPPLTVVTRTISAADAPNLFVSVNGWEATATITSNILSTAGGNPAADFAPDLSRPDAFLHRGVVELHVTQPDKQLQITFAADQAQYAPRQSATFTVTVRDLAGNPQAAELSLALVDEAIFALANAQSGSIYDAFYAPRPHSVALFDSMAPTRYFQEGCRCGGGSDYETGTPRYDFRDTALWLPSVETDADGVAHVTFTLPDNLTTWRLTVKATTGAGTQVGEASTTLTTWQPLVVRPLLPGALTAGDATTLAATLHNESDHTQTTTVWLQTASPLLEVGGMTTQTLSLAPGEVRVVGWPVLATAAGTLSVTIAAQASDQNGADNSFTLQDAVTAVLRINPLAIAERTAHVGQFDQRWATTVTVPAGALPSSQLRIELNRSVAGSFVSGLEYLTGYPYGCVEQTMSRALPNAVVSRALHHLGLDAALLHPDLPGLVNASVQRLYGFQHEDGGWGWWYDDATDGYETAWVIYGLVMTAQSGYEVDPAVIERGVNWLRQNLGSLEPRTQALSLYSLALAAPLLPPAPPVEQNPNSFLPTAQESVQSTGLALLTRFDELDAFSLAALALALNTVGEAEATQSVLAQLLTGITEEAASAHWELSEPDGHYEQKTMASSTRSTALALSALLQIDPTHPLIGKVARWLMDQRRQDGWGSTNETAFTLVALTDYLLATAPAEEPNDYAVEINGVEIAGGTLDATHTTVALTLPITQLLAGANQVTLRQTGETPLYYKVSSDFAVGQSSVAAAGNVLIERRYLDAESGAPLTSVQPGQLVRVELTVAMPMPGLYVLVEDALPGGLEPLNEKLNTTSYIANSGEMPSHNEGYGYNYKEITNEHVRFFTTELSDSQRFSYLARATHAGRFVALPAEVWAMYNSQIWGRSASQMLEIRGG